MPTPKPGGVSSIFMRIFPAAAAAAAFAAAAFADIEEELKAESGPLSRLYGDFS